MKGEGRVQPLRANTYNYCSTLKRERAVSLLLSDLFKKKGKGSFPSDSGKRKKNEQALMLSADLIASKRSLCICLLVYTEREAITGDDLSRPSAFQWSV